MASCKAASRLWNARWSRLQLIQASGLRLAFQRKAALDEVETLVDPSFRLDLAEGGESEEEVAAGEWDACWGKGLPWLAVS